MLNSDQRILAAIRLVDATTSEPVLESLRVHSDSATFIRNRSNHYVIKSANGFDDYVNSFTTPAAIPAPRDVELTIVDPSNKYLTRAATVTLPRDLNPANREEDDSVFKAIDIELFRNVQSKTLVNWSLVRVSALNADESPVAGGYIRVVRISDDEILGRGFTDQRGEALIVIPGIPITEFSDSDDDEPEAAVLVMEVSARVELSVALSAQWPVNPDLLDENHDSQIEETSTIGLRTGRTVSVQFTLT